MLNAYSVSSQVYLQKYEHIIFENNIFKKELPNVMKIENNTALPNSQQKKYLIEFQPISIIILRLNFL